MLNTFLDNATALGNLYKSRKGINIELSHCDEDANARKIAITPAEGWQGKNAEQREFERDRAYAADETLIKIAKRQSELRDDLADLESDIEALEEIRDAMKWTVRQRTAEALSSKSIVFESNNDYSVVEDVAEAQVEAQVFGDDLPVEKETVESADIPF